jgi:uncharacterized protein YacL
MTTEELVAIVGAVLAVLFAYVPGFANWFNPLGAEVKRLIMAGLLILTAGVIFGLSCASILAKVTCDFQGAWGLIIAVLAGIVANQSLFSILPKVGYNKTLK